MTTTPQVVLSVRIKGDVQGPQTGDVVLGAASVSRWEPTQDYLEGEMVIYNDMLFCALQNIKAEPFDPNKWQMLSNGNNFNNLKNRPKYAGVQMDGNTNIPDVQPTIDKVTELDHDVDGLLEDVGELQTDLNTEITTRETQVDGLTTRTNSLETGLAGEIAIRTNQYNELDTRTDGLEARMSDAEDDISAEIAARTGETTAINEAINKSFIRDSSVSTSTTTVNIDNTKENIKTGSTTSDSYTLPIANNTQSGVMNAATYNAVQLNATNIASILRGTVAITGLPENPTQEQLRDAWMAETGLADLFNGAMVYDVDNQKTWTWYENTDTWYQAGSGDVVVLPFTNTMPGTIKGSTGDGQVGAQPDGTGSVNGWAVAKTDILNNKNNIATMKTKLDGIEDGAQVNVQSDWSEVDDTKDSFILNKPGLITATDLIVTDPVTSLVTTDLIADGAVTLEKLAANVILDRIYPVGSIYMTTTLASTSAVRAALGGVWQKWGEGKVPVSVDTSDGDFNVPEKTGGEKKHTLTQNEMPKHRHGLFAVYYDGSGGWKTDLGTTVNLNHNLNETYESGGDQPHNNLQPYITCYMYKRIS